MAAARVWSCPIPYAIGARIASDYAGRPVLPPSQTVCGFAQGQGRVRQWPRRRPLPAVLEPVGSQRGDRQQFQLATGNVEVGGQDFGRSTAGRRHRSGRIGRGCSSMALECTSAAGSQRGKLQPHPPLVDVDRVERRSRYQVTTCSCSSCSGSGAASRNCMKLGTPPTSSGGHRRSPWTNAGYDSGSHSDARPDVSETGASPHSRASTSCALASRRDAQYLRIRSATALRCSSLIARFRLPTALAAFFLPRPAAGGTLPSIASIARCMATS